MVSNNLIDKIRIILNENNVSGETSVLVIKLLEIEKFKSLNHMNNERTKALCSIKMILENEQINDFECIEKILNIFEVLDMDIEYRHDF